jgi:hypothetical protein
MCIVYECVFLCVIVSVSVCERESVWPLIALEMHYSGTLYK